MQKIRQLVKSALLVAPDGYILDIHGPYYSNGRNNAANLLFNNFERDRDGLFLRIQPEDIILNRGYRDVQAYSRALSIKNLIPPFLARKQKQFSTDETPNSIVITDFDYEAFSPICNLPPDPRAGGTFSFLLERVPLAPGSDGRQHDHGLKTWYF